MAFLLRKPFIIIIVTVIAALVLIYFSGILSPEPRGLFISSAEFMDRNSIKIGENATLMVVLNNWADQPETFELHIVYSGNLTFYDGTTEELLQDVSQNDIFYNLTYPTKGTLDMQGSTSIPIIASGLAPIGESQTYTIFVEVFSIGGYDREFADKTSVQLTVTRS